MDNAETRSVILPKGSKKMKTNRGFSLLELLIVVSIILISATIAIPSLLRSRQSAQESSDVAQIRTINTAEITYLSWDQGDYGSVAHMIFFFQAEDGIRDLTVTGVQTCALPI